MMKTLTKYLNEKLVINKDYKNPYTCTPKTFEELRKIIEDRYKKFGPGTKQNSIDFNDVDVSNIDSFYTDINNINLEIFGIFEATKFKYIDISDWDVSKVKDTGRMFYGCTQLKSVGDLSDWDVSKVKEMSSMFYDCINLKSVGDLSEWNVSKVSHMDEMLYNSGITNIPDWYRG